MTIPNARRVTLHDVAALSGVSYQTVSRVINDHPYVAQPTRDRVLEAIAELGYRPNRAAQSLVTRRTHTLAVISFGTDYYGPAQMMTNIERVARASGYDLFFTSVSDTSFQQIMSAIHRIGGRAVDGILTITPIAGTTYESISEAYPAIPIVQIDILQGSNTPSVIIDQAYGSRLVTQHLIDLGHTQIGEISGPLNWFGAQSRHKAYRDTMLAAGLEPGPQIAGDWTAKSGYLATQQLLTNGAAFTALVIGNDQMAIGAIHALRERGLTVPADVSVVGFDDIPEAAYLAPPLTTIRQGFERLGEMGIQYLVELIEEPGTPAKQRVIHPQLIERASAAPPANRAGRAGQT